MPPARAAAPAEGQRRERREESALAAVLDRPLTSYYLLLGSTVLLLVLGLVMVLSASSVSSYRVFGSSFVVFQKQAIWFAVGVPMIVVASRLNVRVWRALAYAALLTTMALLALVPFFGVEINGNKNWLSFGGPFKVQPSEPAKLALVLWGADLLARKVRLLGQWKHLLVPLVPVGGVMIALVLAGNDLGTSLVLIAILLGLLFFAGAPMRIFAGLIAAGLALVLTLAVNAENRVARILSWWDPGADPESMRYRYQGLHGVYALASGGWWGRGPGASREKWGALPEAHNDFIFAVMGEELGLIGTLTVLALFGVLCYGALRVAMRTTDPFVRLAAAAVGTWLTVQTLVNIGAVIGVLPVIGLPLPLVSYGGSALLPTMIALGMLLSFARHEPGAREALGGRQRRSLPGWRRLAHRGGR
jgi:cell division protein FtsW